MKEFLILVKGGHAKHDSMSESERNAYYQQWGKYLEQLKSKNLLIGGAPLARTGTVIEKSAENHRSWKLEGEQSVGGYLLLKAGDLEAAAKATRDCPIFIAEGSVEIRPLESM